MQTSFRAVIEDSSRNKYLFYYSGSSVCCKEVSKDGISRDIMIASQVSEDFLTAIDLQDNLYVVCINKDKGLYLFSYINGEWQLDQILNIQGSDSINLLSLFACNGSIHIIYAKHMTIANFYNIYHLYKPSGSTSNHLNTPWRKNNVGEIYSENINSAYSAVITKEGALHLVYEWFNGSGYQINYSWYDSLSSGWRKKAVTTLFKKDIAVNILYEDNIFHLLCYTFEDEESAIFYYMKKDAAGKDFEFFCLDKIKTDQAVSPYFHVESGLVYASWVISNKFRQYSISREQKNWSKKLDNNIPDSYNLLPLEYVRNRKGKALIVKKTYFTIDSKNNVSLPYFRDNSSDFTDNNNKAPQSVEGDLIIYIPYILDELKSLSQDVKYMKSQMEQFGNKKKLSQENKASVSIEKTVLEQKTNTKDNAKLKKSSFKEQFMSTNKLLHRPEAAALFVGSSALPNPEELSKMGSFEVIENTEVNTEQNKQTNTSAALVSTPAPAAAASKPIEAAPATADDENLHKGEHDSAQKDNNLFKKIGDFFK